MTGLRDLPAAAHSSTAPGAAVSVLRHWPLHPVLPRPHHVAMAVPPADRATTQGDRPLSGTGGTAFPGSQPDPLGAQ